MKVHNRFVHRGRQSQLRSSILVGRDRWSQSELGWYLRSDGWGHGYATEVTRLLIDFGFSVLQRATMWATADPDNLGSLRVLEKCGLTCQGLTSDVHAWRGTRPRVLFTIEAEQWLTRFRALGPFEGC